MSIIYDALKKLGKNHATPASGESVKKPGRPSLKVYLLYVLFVVAGFAIANFIFTILTKSMQGSVEPKVSMPTRAKQKATEAPHSETPAVSIEAEAAPSVTQTAGPSRDKDKFSLTGVFFSENEGYALINNKVVKVGDMVDGATVKRVDLDGVELECDGETLEIENR